MTLTDDQAQWFATAAEKLVVNVEQAVLGKRHVVKLVLTALLANGHVLLEDAPGTGKTLLAKSLAATLDGSTSRIQFTPDLLPSDVTGVSIYDQAKAKFEFRKGPIFATIVLADEINRASPKTQSALLEVMEEGHVTVDGEEHSVGEPFMVIATQNPIEQAGTYALPEAQLDRFLIKTSIGYPDHQTLVALVQDSANRSRSSAIESIVKPETIMTMSKLADEVHVDAAIGEYVSELVTATRANSQVLLGASVRGALSLIRASKAWAIMDGRTFVTPDDVRELAVPVLGHRMIIDPEADFSGVTAEAIVARILADVAPPAYRAA